MACTLGDPLNKSAQRVQDFLASNNLDFKVIELAASTRTANEAAQAIGCEVGQIIKSILFRDSISNQPLLVLASGSNRVNEKTITQAIGKIIVKADADFTKQATGYVIGGIPPIAHKQTIATLIDEELFNYEQLWAAAGTPNAVFNLKSTDLQRLTTGKVIAIK